MLRSCAQVASGMAGGMVLPDVPGEIESGVGAGGLLREFSARLRRAMPGSRLVGDFAPPEAVDAIGRFVEIAASARGSGGVSAP